MTPEQKLWETIEKLSCMTVKRGATPAEEAIAKKKIKVLEIRIEEIRAKERPKAKPKVEKVYYPYYDRFGDTITPERARQWQKNMKEWDDFLRDILSKHGVKPTK